MLGLTNINNRDLIVFARTMKEEGCTNNEILEDLSLIDDLLTLIKSKSLLNKKHRLKNQLSARIGFAVGDEVVKVGGNNQKYF